MSGFFKGLCVGGAIATASLVGYAYGNQQEMPREDWIELTQQCDVDIGYGSPSYSEQCNFNKVMVGYRGEYILCADVRVTCP